MSYQYSEYRGDKEYRLDCTGDAVVGDQVRFDRAVFEGSYRKPKFSHFERVTGKIIAESYGEEKQQHTFTILLDNGKKTRIKGRNLYANGVWRKKWEDESEREKVLAEKHKRGKIARMHRDLRKRATF